MRLLLALALVASCRTFPRLRTDASVQQRTPRLDPDVIVRGVTEVRVVDAEENTGVDVILNGLELYDASTDALGESAAFTLAEGGTLGVVTAELLRDGASPVTQRIYVTTGAPTVTSILSIAGDNELLPGEQAQITGAGFDARAAENNVVLVGGLNATVLSAAEETMIVRLPEALRGTLGVEPSELATNCELTVSIGQGALSSQAYAFVLTQVPELLAVSPPRVIPGERIALFFAQDPLELGGRDGIEGVDVLIDRTPLTNLAFEPLGDYPGKPDGTLTVIGGRVPFSIEPGVPALRVSGPRARTRPEPTVVLYGGDMRALSTPTLLNAEAPDSDLLARVMGSLEVIRYQREIGELSMISDRSTPLPARFLSFPSVGNTLEALQAGEKVYALLSSARDGVVFGSTIVTLDASAPSRSRLAGETGHLALSSGIPVYLFVRPASATVGYVRLDTGVSEDKQLLVGGSFPTFTDFTVLVPPAPTSATEMVFETGGSIVVARIDLTATPKIASSHITVANVFSEVGVHRVAPLAVRGDDLMLIGATSVSSPYPLSACRVSRVTLTRTLGKVSGAGAPVAHVCASTEPAINHDIERMEPFLTVEGDAGVVLDFADSGVVSQLSFSHPGTVSGAIDGLLNATNQVTEIPVLQNRGVANDKGLSSRYVYLTVKDVVAVRMDSGALEPHGVTGARLQLLPGLSNPAWVFQPKSYAQFGWGAVVDQPASREPNTSGVQVVVDDQLRQPIAVAPTFAANVTPPVEIDMVLIDASERRVIGARLLPLPVAHSITFAAWDAASEVTRAVGGSGRHLIADPQGRGFWVDASGAMLFYRFIEDFALAPVEVLDAGHFALPANAVALGTVALFDAETLVTAWRACVAGELQDSLVSYIRDEADTIQVIAHAELGSSGLPCASTLASGAPIELVAMRDAVAFKRTVAGVLHTSIVPLQKVILGMALVGDKVVNNMFDAPDCVRQSVAIEHSLLQWALDSATCIAKPSEAELSFVRPDGTRERIDASLGSPYAEGAVQTFETREMFAGRASRALLTRNTASEGSTISIYISTPGIGFYQQLDFDGDEPVASRAVLGAEAVLAWTWRGLWLAQ